MFKLLKNVDVKGPQVPVAELSEQPAGSLAQPWALMLVAYLRVAWRLFCGTTGFYRYKGHCRENTIVSKMLF